MVTYLIPCNDFNNDLIKTVDSISLEHMVEEILIINDSSHKIEPKISSMLLSYSKVKVIKNISKKGIVGALNTGIKNIKTEFFARIDSGDIVIGERIKKQYEYLQLNPEVDLVCSSMLRSDAGTIIPKVSYVNNLISPFSRVPHPTWFCKTKLFSSLYSETCLRCEDYEILLRVNPRIGVIYEPFVIYDVESNLDRKKEFISVLHKVRLFFSKTDYSFVGFLVSLSYLVLRCLRITFSRKK